MANLSLLFVFSLPILLVIEASVDAVSEKPLDLFDVDEDPDLKFYDGNLDDPEAESKLFRLAKRQAVDDRDHLWPRNTVYYIMPGFSLCARAMIRHAMTYLEKKTCVKFINWNKDKPEKKDRVEFTMGKGCPETFVYGRFPGLGEHSSQKAYIDESCMTRLGYVFKFLISILGIYPQEFRRDRDKYIRFNWPNINQTYQWTKFWSMNRPKMYLYDIFSTFNWPYDYNSVTHSRDRNQFLYNRNQWGMRAKEYENKTDICLGQRMLPTECDLELIRQLYGCGDLAWECRADRVFNLPLEGSCEYLF